MAPAHPAVALLLNAVATPVLAGTPSYTYDKNKAAVVHYFFYKVDHNGRFYA